MVGLPRSKHPVLTLPPPSPPLLLLPPLLLPPPPPLPALGPALALGLALRLRLRLSLQPPALPVLGLPLRLPSLRGWIPAQEGHPLT